MPIFDVIPSVIERAPEYTFDAEELEHIKRFHEAISENIFVPTFQVDALRYMEHTVSTDRPSYYQRHIVTVCQVCSSDTPAKIRGITFVCSQFVQKCCYVPFEMDDRVVTEALYRFVEEAVSSGVVDEAVRGLMEDARKYDALRDPVGDLRTFFEFV